MVVSKTSAERWKARLRLAHDERRAGHRFRAAGDREPDLARLDPARRRGDRFHARGAQAVDGRAGNGLRQAREQERHAREVAVVLARLVGAAEKDLVDFVAEAGMTAHELADGSAARSSARTLASAPP